MDKPMDATSSAKTLGKELNAGLGMMQMGLQTGRDELAQTGLDKIHKVIDLLSATPDLVMGTSAMFLGEESPTRNRPMPDKVEVWVFQDPRNGNILWADHNTPHADFQVHAVPAPESEWED